MKNRDAIPPVQEHKDIRAVREFIRQNSPVSIGDLLDASVGPTTDEELRRAGMSREQQVRRIVSSMDSIGEVAYVTDSYIKADSDTDDSPDADAGVLREDE